MSVCKDDKEHDNFQTNPIVGFFASLRSWFGPGHVRTCVVRLSDATIITRVLFIGDPCATFINTNEKWRELESKVRC